MDQTRLSLLALHFIPGIGDYLVRKLISYCGSADNVFKTPRGKLIKIPGVGEVTADAIRNGKPYKVAEDEIRKAEQSGVKLIFFIDDDYPSRLKRINDSPTLLYVRGNIDFENPKTVGIVGTRKATAYGKSCVENLIEELVGHKAAIISGLAYGIDIHAHKQAVRKNLPTIGVMGSGIDVIYPSIHKDTVAKMCSTGGIVTEHPFGTKPEAHNFPARNRIVAGLCDALVIVEAAAKGGALITAEIANSYNKDVFAFPGNIGQNYSEGCNNLIKTNKAFLLTSVKDLEYLMNWDLDGPPPRKAQIDMSLYDPTEKIVIETLLENGNEQMIDDLSWKCGLSVSQVASALLMLELKGVVLPLPGKKFQLQNV